jgi:2-oxoglutarate dehydrogenase E2 component (dihydrolipoamide succinyltransferase)
MLAYVARAVVSTLPKTPWLNGQIRGESVVTIDHINLGIAVSTDDGRGLLVPVIKNAAHLNVDGLAARIVDLAEQARARSLAVDDLSGATFTITNLGAFGTSGGTPIINTPQVAILGMYAMVRRPVVVRDAEGNEGIGIRSMMNLSMSYDHRIIDGGTAGTFLHGVRSFLENWTDGSYR